jgi:XTP/dITP diphosphohydrolase
LKKLIFASGNKGKIKEIKGLFENTGIEIVSLYDLNNPVEIEETGTTFYENAFIKAKTIYDIYNTPVIADDSGLEVEQLDGRPGVYSARYAFEGCTYDDNNNKVIGELKDLPEPHKAAFVCCAIYYDGSTDIHEFGKLRGRMIMERRGTNGFGFDPIFVPDGYDITLAEIGFEEKNRISHRSRAFHALKQRIVHL